MKNWVNYFLIDKKTQKIRQSKVADFPRATNPPLNNQTTQQLNQSTHQPIGISAHWHFIIISLLLPYENFADTSFRRC